jgi:glutamate-ammonia-ligase adenylyltransferase
MAEGRLYEADMRLRPSGRQGPVATAWGAYRSYQREEAWTWEHLALTRARVVAATGLGPLPEAVEAFRRDLVASRRGDPRVWPDLTAMRARLAEARPGSVWDAKSGPGRLRDLELLSQSLALLSGSPERGTEGQVGAGLAAGLIGGEEAEALTEASRLLWTLQAASRLLVEGSFDPAAAGEGARRVLLREAGEGSVEALAARLARVAGRAAAVIERVTREGT